MRAESLLKLSRAMNISADYILTGKNTKVDYSDLFKLIEPLSEKQLKCLKEILKNFVTACGYELSD